ncbi:MAG: phenylalanine--tRNA ligase subunit beta [Candidatus Helarchaeota archaeon]
MPTIKVIYSDLCKLIGRKISKDEIEELILLNKCEVEAWNDDEMEVEVTSDRIDLLSTEGLARTLKGFLEIELGSPDYSVKKSNVKLNVDPIVNQVRPFIVSGIVENVELSDAGVAQIMQCQEKLHMTHSRNRKKASIGLHDLDKIKPPVTYTARRPDDIYFVPLHEIKAMDGHEILRKVEKGVEYKNIIEHSEVYPLLVDSQDTVLSLPPIINSTDTAVEPDTKNLFFDITCLDEQIAKYALNVLVTNIAERKGQIKTVEIIYPDGRIENLPDLTPEKHVLHLKYVNQVLGLNLSINELEKLILKLRMSSKKLDENILEVYTPAYRADFLHEIDLIEDISVAFGYDKITPELPMVKTIGKSASIESISKKIKNLMIGFGFQEVNNYVLTSKDILFNKMEKKEEEIVELENPMTSTFSVLRSTLLPGMLNFLSSNTHATFPQKCFEIGDVVKIDKKAMTKTKMIRKLCAVFSGYSVSFEQIQSILFALLNNMGFKNYKLEENAQKIFIEGRGATIKLNKKDVGIIGEINFPILNNFQLENPVIAFEIDLTLIFN